MRPHRRPILGCPSVRIGYSTGDTFRKTIQWGAFMGAFAWLFRTIVAGTMLVALIASAGAGFGGQPAAAASRSAAVITLSPNSGPIGTDVAVTGTGFPRKAVGTVTADTAIATFTTNASGSFTATVTIPETTSATVAIRAAVGSTSASVPFTLTYSPPSTTVPPPTPEPGTGTSPAISSARLRFGVSTPGGAAANAELDAVASLVGEAPSIVLSYYDFGQAAPIADLDSVAARGATSLITWEPWRWGGGSVQPAYTNARVAAGDFDAYLQQWGSALARWGKPVLLRYAHEMNGNWYPWSEGINANTSGSYVAAWRHVHDVLSAQGATNVTWVWSPNIPYTGSTPLPGLYPGADYADVVALDGYNWGTAASWSAWAHPTALFDDGLTQLRALAPGAPILIAETASAEAGGSKAAWNTALISYLAGQSDVMGVVWFDHNKEVDWRINSSASSASALGTALAQRR